MLYHFVPQKIIRSVAPGRCKVGSEVVFTEQYPTGGVVRDQRGVVVRINRAGCSVRLVCASRFRRKLVNGMCEHHEKRALSMRGLVLGKLGLTQNEKQTVEVVKDKGYMQHH